MLRVVPDSLFVHVWMDMAENQKMVLWIVMCSVLCYVLVLIMAHVKRMVHVIVKKDGPVLHVVKHTAHKTAVIVVIVLMISVNVMRDIWVFIVKQI